MAKADTEQGVIPANAFVGKLKPPTDAELAAELGTVKSLWDSLLSQLGSEHRLVVREWSSRSTKTGWSLRMMRRERNIVHLSPCHEFFLASFALGDRAVEAASAIALPKRVLKIIGQARKYAEGTAVRIEVRSAEDVDAVSKLAGIKLEH